MAEIARATVQAFIDAGATATTTVEQGRALENLICYVFERVPGISITLRNEMNAFQTEEIDVALWNNAHPEGLFFLPNIILVEAKNWSQAVGSGEVNWFDSKLRNRGLNFGVLVAKNGITGNADDLTAAHAVVAAALREGRRLIVLRTDEVTAISTSEELVRLVKQKLCELAVRGTVA